MLAGEGDVDGVRKAAVAAGVAGRVELPGWVDGEAKAHLLARAGIFVLPSRFEGLPMALLEAQVEAQRLQWQARKLEVVVEDWGYDTKRAVSGFIKLAEVDRIPVVITGGSAVMPGMVELGEDIFLKPVRRGMPRYSSALSDMVAQPRAATVMGLLEEARMGRMRGYKAPEAWARHVWNGRQQRRATA